MSRHARRAATTRKAEETRQRVLEAALALFAERGFEETTMRDVARRAGLATGAAYYYFASKEELIHEFYRESAVQADEGVKALLADRSDLKTRLAAVLTYKFEQFAPYRASLGSLFRSAADPRSSISPFGDATRDVRESAIDLFRQALAGSKVKIPKDLEPHLPRLLWLYQMGLILFWIYDQSEGQARTTRLQERSLDLVVGLIRIARFPLLGPVRKAVVEMLEAVEQ